MDEMSSAEFRKRYPKLTKPTSVTVHGHVIGTYWPGPHGKVTFNALMNQINRPVRAK